MRRIFATVLSALLLMVTACNAVKEPSESSSLSTTAPSIENSATATTLQDFQVYEVVIKGAVLRSQPEVGENVITGLDYGSTVIVLKEIGLFYLVYTQGNIIGYVDCNVLNATGEISYLAIDPETVTVSSPDDVGNKIVVGTDAVFPEESFINNLFPSTLLRIVDDTLQEEMLITLLGNNYKKTEEDETSIKYESTDSSKPYRTVRVDKASGNIWFFDAMVTGEREGEYKAPNMNMLPEESLPVAQEKAAAIVGVDRVSIPSQSWMKYLRVSCGDSISEYERIYREMDSHTFVFERQIYDGVFILDGGVKVTIGVNGISALTIDCSNYEVVGTDFQKPLSLDEALKIVNKACKYSSTLVYANLVYSNYVSRNEKYNLSWYFVTDKGVYVVDCVTKEVA